MINPGQFKTLCSNLSAIVKKQIDVTTKASLGDRNVLDSLNETSQQLGDDMLRVLVMGKFSSGKSTFLNAMMGQKLLPAKPTPTTAVIGEICYGEKPEAILYPKDGTKGGGKPIIIPTTDLPKYIVIDHSESKSDTAKAPNPYKKLVIKYPLEVCKHGIMFVDSPGLDDPTCHDAITQEYLPKADAIVYCMNVQQAFGAGDKLEIERLLALGYKSIIFVLTYYDVLLYNDEMNGTNEADKTRAHYIEKLSRYTDLREKGVFFVGSLPALNAKLNKNEALLAKSNFIPLEKSINQILFNEKGRMKLLKAIYTTRRANRNTGQHLNDLVELANQDRTTINERITAAERDLNQAQAKATEILNQFNIGANMIVSGAKDKGRAFFLTQVLPNLSSWVEEFTPSDEQSISMWHPKASSQAFTEGCIKHVQGRIETVIASWSEDELLNKYIMPRLESLTQQQEANLALYEEDLKKVRAKLNLDLDGDNIADDNRAGNTNRILSAIAGAFLNPASLVTGAAFGWKGLVASLGTTLVGGIILGIISMFTPVGLPALIITWILSAITGGLIVGSGMESKIRKTISEKIREELSNQQEVLASNIGQAVEDVIDKIKSAVSKELNTPVNKYKKLFDEARSTAGTQNADISTRISLYVNLRKENTSIASDLDDFSQSISA